MKLKTLKENNMWSTNKQRIKTEQMSDLKVVGALKTLNDLETITTKSGEMQKVTFVIETGGDYPKQVAFETFGEKAQAIHERLNDNKNNQIEVSFNIESREYNGRWYTTAKAWKVWGINSASEQKAEPVTTAKEALNVNGDLPF